MTKEEYLKIIVKTLERFNDGGKPLTSETQFMDIPRLDSMAIVDFQIELKKNIGAVANALPRNAALAIMPMTLGEFADLLVSLS